MSSIKTFAVALFITLSLIFSSNAFAQKVNWRIAQTWSKDFPVFGDTVKRMVKHASELSNGELEITIVPSGEHGQPLGIFELVQDGGGYQMGHSASYYWQDRDINMLFFTTLPFGMTTSEQYAWYYHAGGKELMQRAYEPYGLLSFPGGNTGNQMGGWFTKEINTVEDFQGLKIRIPGIAGDVLKALGADIVNSVQTSRFSDALKSGELEAVEWVGPSLDMKLNLHESAPFYYTGWHEPATEMQFLVNQQAYESLPENLQGVLDAAINLASYETYHAITHDSINNLDRILSDFPEVTVRAFPPAVMQALRKATVDQIYDYATQGNDLTREIVISIFNYKDKARFWTRISDQSYLNNADF